MARGDHWKGKPPSPLSGRKKGQSSYTTCIRDAFQNVLTDTDPEKGIRLENLIRKVHDENPVELLKMIVKLAPTQIEGVIDKNVNMQISFVGNAHNPQQIINHSDSIEVISFEINKDN
jgi:hypothetical protein